MLFRSDRHDKKDHDDRDDCRIDWSGSYGKGQDGWWSGSNGSGAKSCAAPHMASWQSDDKRNNRK